MERVFLCPITLLLLYIVEVIEYREYLHNMLQRDYHNIINKNNFQLINGGMNLNQKIKVLDAQDLISLKTSISLCIGDVKFELENLRKDLVNFRIIKVTYYLIHLYIKTF